MPVHLPCPLDRAAACGRTPDIEPPCPPQLPKIPHGRENLPDSGPGSLTRRCLTALRDGRSLKLPKFRATRGTRGNHRRHCLQGRSDGNVAGHFRVLARQLTSSAFNGSARLASHRRRALCGFCLFGHHSCVFCKARTCPQKVSYLRSRLSSWVVRSPLISPITNGSRV